MSKCFLSPSHLPTHLMYNHLALIILAAILSAYNMPSAILSNDNENWEPLLARQRWMCNLVAGILRWERVIMAAGKRNSGCSTKWMQSNTSAWGGYIMWKYCWIHHNVRNSLNIHTIPWYARKEGFQYTIFVPYPSCRAVYKCRPTAFFGEKKRTFKISLFQFLLHKPLINFNIMFFSWFSYLTRELQP